MKEENGRRIFNANQELVWYYKDKKDSDIDDKLWQKLYFARNSKTAGIILKDLAGGDIQKGKRLIDETISYCSSRELEWTLETVIKVYPQIRRLLIIQEKEDLKKIDNLLNLKLQEDQIKTDYENLEKNFTEDDKKRMKEYVLNLPAGSAIRQAVEGL